MNVDFQTIAAIPVLLMSLLAMKAAQRALSSGEAPGIIKIGYTSISDNVTREDQPLWFWLHVFTCAGVSVVCLGSVFYRFFLV